MRLIIKRFIVVKIQLLLLKSALYVAERTESGGELLRAAAFKSSRQLNCLWLRLYDVVGRVIGEHSLLLTI